MDPMSLIRKYYASDSQAFRTLVRHSSQVAQLADTVAARLASTGDPVDRVFVAEAAWLHDIGVFLTDSPKIGCHGTAPYLSHGVLGADLLRQEGLPRHALVCERHVGVGLSLQDIEEQQLPLPRRDMTPQTLEEEIVAYADLFFSKNRKPGKGPRPPEKVRAKLARHGPHKTAIFDQWHRRFGDSFAVAPNEPGWLQKNL